MGEEFVTHALNDIYAKVLSRIRARWTLALARNRTHNGEEANES